jgi:high-affinity Fe2+/Pb2+ permease
MAAQSKCHCQSCTIRGLVGPAVVITLGVLWLLNEVHGGRFYFGSTWPLLLIVIGLVHLASSMASREGHVDATPRVAPPASPAPPATGAGTPQTPYSPQGQ